MASDKNPEWTVDNPVKFWYSDIYLFETVSGVTFWFASVSSTHKGHTQMEYPFVYAHGVTRYITFSMYCTTQGVYRNRINVYICKIVWWNIVQVRMLHRVIHVSGFNIQ